MKHHDTAQETSIPANRLAEAGVWVARLHGDERGPQTEAGFRQWLSAHPLNGQAFELATEVWEDAQELRRVVPFAYEAPAKARRRVLIPALLAAAVAAVAVVAHWWPRDIQTGVGEQRLLTLEDGSRIYLNTATRVAVRYSRDRRDIELKTGEALFDVARDTARPFVVQAGDQRVTALGTSFAVRHDPRRTAVVLVTGKVAVEARQDSPSRRDAPPDTAVTLQPGQRLTIVDHQPGKLDTPVLDSAIAWRRGQVVLKDTPLSEAIDEMNRYSASRLEVEDPEAARLRVDGLFQAGDSASFARVVALTYGLTVMERTDRILLQGKPMPVSDTLR